ncbi:MAG: antibiotic resistance protein [Rhizobiales bacterium 24-66-13]|jgi:multiple antibiotic resistance protein|nr:MAG: antibiotic resistance protein [Azorhizobium sp. 12-66-6]OYZ72360.1 MAG: antibiotic resistance protein [Rhizobiales bacterium 24-66-13]OZB02320.1 MAG: antibiotic resistance protein [Rhizobiales bacterium 39-66-18]
MAVGGARVSQFINVFLAVFAALFPVVNPLGGAPIFYQFTRGASPATRAMIARKIATYGFVLLLCSMVLGSHILTFFGISLPVVRVGGGMVVAFVGWQILHQGNAPADRQTDNSSQQDVDVSRIEDQAFYPLTMPLTVGPGSIATAIALGSQVSAGTTFSYTIAALEVAAAVLGLLSISITILLAYRYAGDIERILGPNGTNILVRLFAFVLLCIGLQIMWTGASELLSSLPIPHQAARPLGG